MSHQSIEENQAVNIRHGVTDHEQIMQEINQSDHLLGQWEIWTILDPQAMFLPGPSRWPSAGVWFFKIRWWQRQVMHPRWSVWGWPSKGAASLTGVILENKWYMLGWSAWWLSWCCEFKYLRKKLKPPKKSVPKWPRSSKLCIWIQPSDSIRRFWGSYLSVRPSSWPNATICLWWAMWQPKIHGILRCGVLHSFSRNGAWIILNNTHSKCEFKNVQKIFMKMIENVWKYVRVLSSLQTLTVRSFRFGRQPVSGQFPACESKGPITVMNLTYPAVLPGWIRAKKHWGLPGKAVPWGLQSAGVLLVGLWLAHATP